jgi:hypothetical protein
LATTRRSDGVNSKNTEAGSTGRRMERVSSKFVRDTLEAAEIEFRWSQKTLAAMRRPNEHKDIGQTILKFQPQLTDALARLESAYRFVKQEEKRLISKKPNYQFDWFKRRMATLASYTKAMNEWIAIGRAIGDGFAWIFYQNDRHLIDEHLKLQRQPLLPPNLGGLDFGKYARVGRQTPNLSWNDNVSSHGRHFPHRSPQHTRCLHR